MSRGKDLPHQEGILAVCWQQQGCASGREGSKCTGGSLHSRVYPCSGMDSSCTRMAWHSFLPWSFPHRPRGLRILGLQVKLSSAKAPEARGATRIIPHKVLQRFPRLPSFHTQTFVSWLTQIQHQMRYCSPLWLCHRREGGERKKQKAPKDYNC